MLDVLHDSSCRAGIGIVRGKSLFFLVALAVALSGCVRSAALFGGHVRVDVQVAERVNRDSAVAVNLLYVYDEKLLDALLKMPASAWFEQREQMLRDYSGAHALEMWEWEWVPGQIVDVQRLPLRPSARAGIVFAGYHAPGDHRARFDPHRDVQIRLMDEDVEVMSVR